jgi:hypothetical protein
MNTSHSQQKNALERAIINREQRKVWRAGTKREQHVAIKTSLVMELFDTNNFIPGISEARTVGGLGGFGVGLCSRSLTAWLLGK